VETLKSSHPFFTCSLKALALSTAIVWAPLAKSDTNPISIKFTPKSYQLSESARSSLKTIVADAQGNSKLTIVITEKTGGLKKSSLPYILERDRVLSVFKELATAGIDPARISYKQVPTAKMGDVTVEVAENESPPSTAVVTPGTSAEPAAAGELTFNFASGSAEPENASDDSLKPFLKSVGTTGRDAIVIEGFTDSVGNHEYNKALGELRALTVYELLVRAGLPPYRVDTQSRGGETTDNKAGSAADRRVVIRWQVNEKIAEAAKAVEPTPAPLVEPTPTPEAAPTATPVTVSEPAPTSASKSASTIEIIAPFVGWISPLGQFADDVNGGLYYGLGLGKTVWNGNEGSVRTSLAGGYSELESKRSGIDGEATLTTAIIRVDYIFPGDLIRPFIGAGAGLYSWKAKATQGSTRLVQEKNRNDGGALVAIGFDVIATHYLMIEPTVEWHSVGGNFNESLLSGLVTLRWSL
jgi:outer membrane protein OmpA-like peptidoglycan-associated protein